MPDEKLQAAISAAVKQAAGWWPFGNKPATPPDFKKLAPLGAPPSSPPKLPEVPPKTIGDQTFPGDAPATLGQHIGRWYANTGGLDKAINSAQQAQQNRNPQVLHDAAWPKWQPSDVTQRTVPVRVGLDDPFANGSWSAANPAAGFPDALVEVRPEMARHQGADGKWNESPRTDAQGNLIPHRPTLEHELSHNAYVRDKNTRDAMHAAQNNPAKNTVPDYKLNLGPLRADGTPAIDDYTRKYLLSPAETDVRLAEIKRRYAHHTGKLVETPAQAQEAWNWWRENSPRLHGEAIELPGDPNINQKIQSFSEQGNTMPAGTSGVRPIREWWDKQYNRGPAQNWEEEQPSLKPDHFQLYDSLPDANKKQLFHRMPELVQQPNQAVQKFGAAVKRAYDWQGRRQSTNVVDMRNAPPATPSMFDFKVRNGSGRSVTVSPAIIPAKAQYRLSNWWNGTGNTPQAQAVREFQAGNRNGTTTDIDKTIAAAKNKYYTPLPDPELEVTPSTFSTEPLPPPRGGSRYFPPPPPPPPLAPPTPAPPNDTQVTGGLFEPDEPLQKESDLKPEIILQPHQQRVADRVSGPNPRMLVYHGLGTGKSLAAIAAAEAAKKNSGGEYAIVAPASLRDNFRKEIDKFTTGSNPDILSYTGLGLGQTPKNNPETLIFDEAHRLRNPEGLAAQAAVEAAQKVPRVALLTGSPITNEPSDLANLMSILRNEKITPESFENKYVQYKKVKPGWGGWLRGVKPGEEADVKNPEELKAKLRGHVDFNPGKSPEGVNINQQIIDAPMSDEQERIQKAIRTKIPPRFLWKLDKEFPLSREELGKLNAFLTGMRQISLSTQPFRADKDYLKAFDQSGKLQTAMQKLQETLNSDPRKKALIYSNYIDAGLQPYAAALAKNKIPHAIFHGGIPLAQRRQALDEYNAGKLRALLIGPAGAEGISTKGTSLIQLLDPHWNETRSQQAQGRGLRFDSHMDLPEELKNVAVQRFISRAKEPGWFKKHIMGAQKVRTGDEILDTLAKEKEKANDKFRAILKQVGSESQQEETARRMFEEQVPDEQQRKAAGLAWSKMAIEQQPFTNQFTKKQQPLPYRVSPYTGDFKQLEPGIMTPYGWPEKPQEQQNTLTPAQPSEFSQQASPYKPLLPWNQMRTRNVQPPTTNLYQMQSGGLTPVQNQTSQQSLQLPEPATQAYEGAKKWTTRNYAGPNLNNKPVGRLAAHKTLSSQIPTGMRGYYRDTMDGLFYDKVKNTAGLPPFQLQQSNQLTGDSASFSSTDDPKKNNITTPESYIRVGQKSEWLSPYTAATPGVVGLHELEHQRQLGHSGYYDSAVERMKTEPPAVLSELVHAAQGVHHINNKPVQGVAPLTPNYQPGLEWMRRQARQHGHIGGDKSMTELLNTPEGQAWMNMQYRDMANTPDKQVNRVSAPPAQLPPAFTTPTSEAEIRALARRFAVPQ